MSYTFHSHLTREKKHASQEDDAFPDLLDGLSPELKKRMQGKSCFNFKAVDKALFKELGALTRQGYQRFKKEGLV